MKVLSELGKALAELSGSIRFERAVAFGSVTRPYRFTEDSDVDVAFSGLSDRDFFRAMAFLSRCLGREVDVVQLEGHRLAGKIEREGIPWDPKNASF